MSMGKIVGGCLCGQITFEIAPPFEQFGHCYCSRCRKSSGSGRSSVFLVSPQNLNWTKGGEKVRRWDLPAADSFATSFCVECGCQLPRLTRDKSIAVIPAGSLSEPLPVLPGHHEHWGAKANWVVLDETELPIYYNEVPGE